MKKAAKVGAFEPEMKFEVFGAGTLRLQGTSDCVCGKSRGVSVGVSWGEYGYAGGVMDVTEMVRLRDHLNNLLDG